MAECLEYGGSSIKLSNGFLPARLKPPCPSPPQHRPISPVPSWKLYQNPFYDGLFPRITQYSRSGAHIAGSDPSSSRIRRDSAAMNSAHKQSSPSSSEHPETQLIHSQGDAAAHLREDGLARSDIAGVKALPSSTAHSVSEALKCTAVLSDHKCSQISSESNRALSMPETEEREKAIATTSDASCALNEILQCANLVEDSHTDGMSLFSTLQVELEEASSRLQQLELSQKSVLSEIDGLLKKIEEGLPASRRPDHGRAIQETIRQSPDKKEEERNGSSTLLKVENDDLSKYVAEANVRAPANTFDWREMKGGLMTEVWNELVKAIEEDKTVPVEELKQEKENVREEAEEDKRMLPAAEEALPDEKMETRLSETQPEVESKNFVALEDLKSKLEAFVGAIKRCSEEQAQIEQAEMLRRTFELLQEGSGSLHSNVEASETNKSDTEKVVESSVLYQILGESDHGNRVQSVAQQKENQALGNEEITEGKSSEANRWKDNLFNGRRHYEDHVLGNLAWHDNNEMEKKRLLQPSDNPVDPARDLLHHHASSCGDSHSVWLLNVAPAPAHYLHSHTSSNEASSFAHCNLLPASPHHHESRGARPSEAPNSAWHLDPPPPAHPLPAVERSFHYEVSNSAVRHNSKNLQDHQPSTSSTPHQQRAGSFWNPVSAYHSLPTDTEWKTLLLGAEKHPADFQPNDHTSSSSAWQTRSELVEKPLLQSYSPHHDHGFGDPASAQYHQYQSRWKELLSPDKVTSVDPRTADHDRSLDNSLWQSSSSEWTQKLQEASSSHHRASNLHLGGAPAFFRHCPNTQGEEILPTRNADRKPAGQMPTNSAWQTKRSDVDEDRYILQASAPPRHHSRSLCDPPPANRLLYPESRWKDFGRHPGGNLPRVDQTREGIDWHKHHVQDPSLRHAPAQYPHNIDSVYRSRNSEWHSCCEVKKQHELQSSPRSRLQYTDSTKGINPDHAHYLRHHIGSGSFAAPNTACHACNKEQLEFKERHQLPAPSPERRRAHSTGRFSDRTAAQYHHRHYASTRASPELDLTISTQQYSFNSPELPDHQHLLHQQRIPLLKMPQAVPSPDVGSRPPVRLWPASPPPDTSFTFANRLKGFNTDSPKFSKRGSMHAQLLETSRQTSDGIEKPTARALRFSSFRRSGRSN